MDSSSLVARIQGVRAAFPDLDFLNPGGTLQVPVALEGIQRLRVRVPGRTHLHLHAINLETTGDDDWRDGAGWSSSSLWRDDLTDAVARQRLFEPQGDHDAAMHTELEDSPWLEVSLARPVDLSRITLHNIMSPNASRARGIQVLAGGAEGSWTKVYDGRARVQLLRSVLAQQDRFRPALLDPKEADLAAVVVDMGVGAYKRADSALQRLAWITDAERAELRHTVNHGILAARELEWTIHGVKRSFRYWAPEEKRAYVGLAVEVADRLRELTPHTSFGFGAVLAVVRDGDLIPHDDDLDLLVAFEPHEARTLAEANQRMSAHLARAGYAVSGSHLAHRQVGRRGAPKKLDVFVGIFEGDAIAWFPGARGSLDRTTMFPTSVAPFLGHDCPLPRSPLQYLETVYGPTWRNPDPAFRHSWLVAGYADIAGPRDGTQ